MSESVPRRKTGERSVIQQLLRPAVALMNRLSYPQKFSIISLLFILPLILVLYLLISEINNQIAFSRKKMEGINSTVPLCWH